MTKLHWGVAFQEHIRLQLIAWGYPISRLFRTRRYNRMVKEKEDMLLLFLAVLAVLAEGPPNLLGVFKLLALEGSLSRSVGL